MTTVVNLMINLFVCLMETRESKQNQNRFCYVKSFFEFRLSFIVLSSVILGHYRYFSYNYILFIVAIINIQ